MSQTRGMRQLSGLDAQFLHVESRTTVGHVGGLIVLDPAAVPWRRADTRRRARRPRAPTAPRRAAPAAARHRAVRPGTAVLGRRSGLRHRVPSARGGAAGAGRRPAARRASRADPRPAARPHPAALGAVPRAWHRRGPTGDLREDPPRRDRRGLWRRDPEHHPRHDARAADRGAAGRALAARAAAERSSSWPPADSPRLPRSRSTSCGRCPAPCRTSPTCPGRRWCPAFRPSAPSPTQPCGAATSGSARDGERRMLTAPPTPLNAPITAHRRFAYGSLPLDRREDSPPGVRHVRQRRGDGPRDGGPSALAARSRRPPRRTDRRRRSRLGARRQTQARAGTRSR